MVRLSQRFALLSTLVIIPSIAVAQLEPLRFSLSAVKRSPPSPQTIELADWVNRTDVQWYGTIQIGTPPQNFTVAFDSNDPELIIPGISCDSCGSQNKFDPTKSSTFANYTGYGMADGETYGISRNTSPIEGEADWMLIFDRVNDTVTLGDLTVQNATFYLINSESASFAADPYDGVLGLSLAPGGESGGFYRTLINQGLPKLFSFYLTHDNTPQAELTLGGVDDTKYTGSLKYTDTTSNGFWQVTTTGIYVNGKTTDVLKPSQPIQPIIDSTLSTIVFTKEQAEAVYSLISSDIKPISSLPGAYGIPCSHISSLPAQIEIGLTSQTGEPFNLTIPSSELNVGPLPSDQSTCQTLINAINNFDVETSIPVIGGSLLKHYYTVFDLQEGNGRIGFADSKN